MSSINIDQIIIIDWLANYHRCPCPCPCPYSSSSDRNNMEQKNF